MSALPGEAQPASRPDWAVLGAAGAVLVVLGLAGIASPAWGYALFIATGVAFAVAAGAAAVLLFTRAGPGERLGRWALDAAIAGAVAYALAVCALAGAFARETLDGRMEWHWILFGPAALLALAVLDAGLYRKLVRNNLPTWTRFRRFIGRGDAEPEAMRRVLVDDVIVQKALWRASPLRWVRHALIFWGFLGMFALELAAVLLREAVPAFGWRDIWREPGHPVRALFDFGFDLTGVMVLAGCLLALAWRAMVNGTPERKYADTPTAVFLLVVVLSGFLLEALRILPTVGDPAHGASFAGLALARALQAAGLSQPPHLAAWVVHALIACAFIAYVPLKRMVHTCATPLGRLMFSQKDLLAAKKRGVLGAMLRPPAPPRP